MAIVCACGGVVGRGFDAAHWPSGERSPALVSVEWDENPAPAVGIGKDFVDHCPGLVWRALPAANDHLEEGHFGSLRIYRADAGVDICGAGPRHDTVNGGGDRHDAAGGR